MTLESGVVVVFELPPQEPLLLGGGEDAPLPACGGARRKIASLPLDPKPTLESGEGDAENLDDLPPRGSSVRRRQCPCPEILRVCAHALSSYEDHRIRKPL